MTTPWGDLTVLDAHAHLFSRRFFEALHKQRPASAPEQPKAPAGTNAMLEEMMRKMQRKQQQEDSEEEDSEDDEESEESEEEDSSEEEKQPAPAVAVQPASRAPSQHATAQPSQADFKAKMAAILL